MPHATAGGLPAQDVLYYRHSLPVRLMHWTNVVALTILLMSGLQIFNAHPNLYWAGKSSYTGAAPILAIGAKQSGETVIGTTRIFGREFDTTGVLGISRAADGQLTARGFPWWMTIPDNPWLSMARAWHFFFAWVLLINGLVYVAYGAASRHLARDLAPDRNDWRSIGRSIRDHLLFRPPKGEAAKRYNVLQKLAYLVVIFVLLPLIILMGHRDEPVDEFGAAGVGGSIRRPAGGPDAALRRRLAARAVRGDPRLRGDRVGALEPSALDDHRPVSHPIGGRP